MAYQAHEGVGVGLLVFCGFSSAHGVKLALGAELLAHAVGVHGGGASKGGWCMVLSASGIDVRKGRCFRLSWIREDVNRAKIRRVGASAQSVKWSEDRGGEYDLNSSRFHESQSWVEH